MQETWDIKRIEAFPKWDTAEHLDSEEVIAAFLAEFDTPENAQHLESALAVVKRARAMHNLPEKAGDD